MSRAGKRGRAKTPEAAREALEQVYAQLPEMQCQGLCADSCCSMALTVVEQRNIREQTGKTLPLAHAGSFCPALTMLKQCSVYEVRPAICRLWGMVPAMRCNYGCRPVGGFLTDKDAYELLAKVCEIGGDHEQAAAYRAPFATPALEAQAGRVLRSLQKDRDLVHLEKSRRPGVVHVAAPGRIVKRSS